MLVIGLTGGIASGKTLVSDAFSELKAPIVDADILARRAVEPGGVGLTGLTDLFGARILLPSGELDRKTLRDIIFENPEARAEVDGLLHPLIRTLSEAQIEHYQQQDHLYLIHAVPLLVETNQVANYDRIAVVDVPTSLQRSRLMARDNLTADKAMNIIQSQASREDRLAVADDVIENSGTVNHTLKQVNDLHRLYCELGQKSVKQQTVSE